MSAQDNLSYLQFQHHDQPESHLIVVTNRNKRWVGSMEWRRDTGEIQGLGVEQRYRRRGVATRMWDIAHQYDPSPVHSAKKTAEGSAWARAVGD